MRRDVSLCRVIAMVLIIFCHLFGWMRIPALSQLLNVGVFVFLIISGFLYSNKEIAYSVQWLISRWLKIYVPMIIWVLIVVLMDIAIFKQIPKVKETVLFFLNLQGIGWIVKSIPTIGNMGGYWAV